MEQVISQHASAKPARSGTRGIVFDITRFSVNDGPGKRTLVFLKGCPLRCAWCANPESQTLRPQIGFEKEKCASCLQCVQVCPFGETFRTTGSIDWDRCTKCMACVQECHFGARYDIGKRMTADEVVDVVRRDQVFYRNSGGGMTLGGGEATLQYAFAAEILSRCRNLGINTALETCGFTREDRFDSVVKHVDLLLYDLKHMNSEIHKKHTGVDNALILKNAIRASRAVSDVIVRFPLIPGFNDGRENIVEMGSFISTEMANVRQVDVLPYHSHGASKAERIGKKYGYDDEVSVPEELLTQVREILEGFGLTVSIGG